MNNISLFSHKIDFKVRFSDLDAMGHVNNAKYLTYLEEARIDYLNKLLALNRDNLKYQAVIAKIDINYLNQITLGDQLEIYSRIFKLGNKSFDFEILIVKNKNGKRIIASSSISKMVGYDYNKQKTVVLPESFREIVRSFEKEVEG